MHIKVAGLSEMTWIIIFASVCCSIHTDTMTVVTYPQSPVIHTSRLLDCFEMRCSWCVELLFTSALMTSPQNPVITQYTSKLLDCLKWGTLDVFQWLSFNFCSLPHWWQTHRVQWSHKQVVVWLFWSEGFLMCSSVFSSTPTVTT